MNQKTDDVIIQTHLGLVSGAKKKNGYLFKGIPYGADTSGDNRWRAPQEPEPWEGVLEATEFGPQCPQFRMGEGGFRGSIANAYGVDIPSEESINESEDCLRLNIYTPNPTEIIKKR